jgi:hypothetical protein
MDLLTDERLRPFLADDEHVQLRVGAADPLLAVTDRRVLVVADRRVLLAVGFGDLRRVEFDIERARPATLVIVPDSASLVPQVLAIPPHDYDAAAQALAVIGRRLAHVSAVIVPVHGQAAPGAVGE